MAKIILITDDGETRVLRDDVNNNLESYDVLLRSDYIATKLWTVEDVESVLMEYQDVDEADVHRIAEEVSVYLDCLGDCDDADWETIRYAIDNYLRR